MEPDDAREAAAVRAEAARRRAEEILDRLTQLAAGRKPGPADLQAAQQHADEAEERALESLDRAVSGHERAARSHERTAAVHDEARRRGLGDPQEHAARAAEHRRGAAADRLEAARDLARRKARARPVHDEGEQG